MSNITRSEQLAIQAVDDVAGEMVEFLQQIVRIPTVNPPGECYVECTDVIADRLTSLGYRVERYLAEGHREHTPEYPRVNVVGRLDGRHSNPCVHFSGHYDVVPPGEGWSVDPFGGEIRDGRLYGRGTCDMKAGIAASIYAVEAIRRAGITLRGTVEQSATADEESGGYAGVADLCDKGIIARGRQDHVVITEPLNHDRVCIGHRGVYWFEVTTLGRIGHGSMPGYGVNAADTMTAFIHALNTELRPRIESRETAMPVVPEQARRPTLNLNALHGGQALHADHLLSSCVADRCVAVWDRRYLHEESFESVREEIVEVLDRLAASDPRFRYELRDLWSVPPIATPRKAPVVGAFGRAIAEVVGREPTVVMSPGTYDHKHVTMRAGIVDCIAYGPGRLDLAHLPDEFVDIDELVAAAKVMAVATMRLAGTE